MSSFGQIDQGEHNIGKSLIYSMRNVFLDGTVLELVYKFDDKSYRECLKGESIPTRAAHAG